MCNAGNHSNMSIKHARGKGMHVKATEANNSTPEKIQMYPMKFKYAIYNALNGLNATLFTIQAIRTFCNWVNQSLSPIGILIICKYEYHIIPV